MNFKCFVIRNMLVCIVLPNRTTITVTVYCSDKENNCYGYCVLYCQTVQLLLLLCIVVQNRTTVTV